MMQAHGGDFQTAIENVDNGGTINITGNFNLGDNVDIYDKNFTITSINNSAINCANYSINIRSGAATTIDGNLVISGSEGAPIRVYSGGTVNISGGEIIVNVFDGYGSGIDAEYGTVNISGGEITVSANSSNGIRLQNSTADISGGTIEVSGNNGTGIAVYNSTLNICGNAEIEGTTQGVFINNENNETVIISGGEITASADNGNGINVNRGNVEINGGLITSTSSGNSGYGITLQANCTVNISGGIITASGSNSEGVRVNGGTANISGSASISAIKYGIYSSNGTINISGGAISASSIGSRGIYLFYSTLNISGNAEINANQYGVYVDNGTVKVIGGTTTADDTGILVVNGTANIEGGIITAGNIGIRVANGTANIEGGSISSSNQNGIGIKVTNGSEAKISGGSISASGNYGAGIQVEGGTLEISGGEITASADYGNGIYVINGNVEISGGNISANGDESYGVYIENGTAEITGGSISGEKGVLIINGTSCITVSPLLSLTGGVHSGTSKVFLAALPSAVTMTMGETEIITLDGVDASISFAIVDESTDEELRATFEPENNKINLNPSKTGQYNLVLNAQDSDTRILRLTIPVEVEPCVVTIAAITGVTPPIRGETPVAEITETDQYTGTVSWSPNHNPFKSGTAYTATITLTPKEGYTLTGVPANFFTVTGASSASNEAGSGIVTAVFPATKYAVIYDANGGTGTAPTENDKAPGETFVAAGNPFDPPDTYKMFICWNTAANGTGTSYDPGATVTMPSQDLTLYAIWVLPELSGSVSIVGEAKYESTLSALPLLVYNPDTDEDEPSYQWKRDGADIAGATGSVYTITQEDIGSRISITVTADGVHAAGSLTSEQTAAVEKADRSAPPAPVVINKTHNSVTLEANSDYEFSRDGTNWQTGNVFTGLSPETSYTFIARFKETATHKASPASPGISVATDEEPVIPTGGSDTDTGYTPAYRAIITGTGSTGTTLTVNVNTGTKTATAEPGTTLTNNIFAGTGSTVLSIPAIPGVNSYTLGIPASSLSGSQGEGSLTFSTAAGSITIPSDMLAGIPGTEGKKAGITIGQRDKSSLPADVQAAIGERPVVQLTLTVDGKQTEWNNPEAPVTVSIPYTPTAEELASPENIVVWYIDGSGNAVSVPNGRYDPATGTVTFTTTHFSYFAVSYKNVSFKDVADNAWYARAVSFIAAREITTGTGDGNFSPEAKLTRGQFIVMLMKAYGISPDISPEDNFYDAGNTYYTGYLAAAKRLGISAGVGGNMFAPEKEITRQEMFTLLYNALKVIGQLPESNSGKTLSDFSDAEDIALWAKDAMKLLVETGTISGSGDILSPKNTTTRAQMAQVLYNLLSK